MAPIEAVETLPYSVVNCLAFSPTYWIIARRSLEIEQQQGVVVGDLEDQLQHPDWVGLRLSRRASSKGPHVGDRGPHRMARFAEHIPEHGRVGTRLVLVDADCSEPFHELLGGHPGGADARQVCPPSAMNTGTPMLEKDSASFAGSPSCRCRLRR